MRSPLPLLTVCVALASTSALALDPSRASAYRRANGVSYALALPEGGYVMSGTGGASHSFDALRRQHGDRFLWFEHKGEPYVVTDAVLLAKLDPAAAKVLELGQKQGALGAKQGQLGGEQGKLGARQGELGGKIAEASLRGEDEAARRIEREIEQLAQQQEALGKEQERLGAQQEKLGQEQERASEELEKRVVEVAAEALRSGKAKKL